MPQAIRPSSANSECFQGVSKLIVNIADGHVAFFLTLRHPWIILTVRSTGERSYTEKMKTLLKDLHRELLKAHRKASASRIRNELEKSKARLQYEKIQLMKKSQPYDHITTQIQEITEKGIKYPPMEKSVLRDLIAEGGDKNNLLNVVQFLRSQRTYNELLERYNPGLSMSAEENVRRSANRVGLLLPENR